MCLGLEGQEQSACELEIFLPDELKTLSISNRISFKSLVKGRFTLKADHYDQLIDSPFELADQTRFSFETHGIEHEFVISGTHATNVDRLKRILKNLCSRN